MNDKEREKDERYMRMALQEARAAFDAGEIPVGAIVVCKDRVVARAHNLTERLGDVTAHAEMQAITSAAATLGGKYLTDCTLYVTLEPCVMCAGAIGWAQLSRLVFGAGDDKRGYRRFAPDALHPKTQVEQGILAGECVALMKDFFARRR
ncbi:nucleoside deaminase [Barnesiella sp. An55]|uniref:nucleoside deaminase n=1 Tax=Barnesiella sp. An55 TaxID=1965646 RepID=UPI000B3A2CA9|nr:nucleoside deaminase [Barnesiella sp. An55]OUN74241.1 tRNA-specific adenosine deaminase [Barnesiella sp. An55]HIZ26298.1 nucleoside deaminase [Candidatus Barnesiella merdipullorum]